MALAATAAVLAVPFGIAAAVLWADGDLGEVAAEWTLAFGGAKMVSAVVTGSSPTPEGGRTCAYTRINVVWPAPAGTHSGHFTVCDYDASQFPAGRVIQVAVDPGNPYVIQGESPAGAIVGVVIESVLGACFLLSLVLAARWWLVLRAAPARARAAPWLPGEIREGVLLANPFWTTRRRDVNVVFVVFDPGSVPWPARRHQTIRKPEETLPPRPERSPGLVVADRADEARTLVSGDQAWIAPTGRSLIRRRRTQPYAIIRASDRALFWGRGKPLPGGW